MTIKNSLKQLPNEKGYFGSFGGRYVSETLMPLILEVEKEYDKIKSDNNFKDLNTINKLKNIEYLLFDYKPDANELPGGNSKSFDWNLLKGKEIKLPWFISGGINETNIKNIQNLLNPNGIDLSSGVEVSKGIKSNLKINNLFKKFYDN